MQAFSREQQSPVSLCIKGASAREPDEQHSAQSAQANSQSNMHLNCGRSHQEEICRSWRALEVTETPVLNKGGAPKGRGVNPQSEVLAHCAASALQVKE